MKNPFTLRRASWGLPLFLLARLKAEDQVVYRHQSYVEQNDRTRVETDAWLVQTLLAPWLDLKIDGAYDAITGATPIGAPAPSSITLNDPKTGATQSGSSIRRYRRAGGNDAVSGASPSGTVSVRSEGEVPTVSMADYRTAVNAAAEMTFGRHHLTPRYSHSGEHDYLSHSFGLSYALDLNQKNTTINAGWSHDMDHILPNINTYITQKKSRDTDNFLLGVTQLLGPKTVLTVNAMAVHSSGYMNDPYKGVLFENTPYVNSSEISIYEEKRPGHRTKETAFFSLTQAIGPLDASVEGSYRYYHDSYEIHAHTLSLIWHQKIGSWVVLSPNFRYYLQTAASFYGTSFPGNPDVAHAAVPQYYSSDYRLSALETFAYGLRATVNVRQWLAFDAAYQRYDMRGRDGVTAASLYPTADLITIGATFKF